MAGHSSALTAGAISKGDLKRFLTWAATNLGYSELAPIGEAAPTAELEPLREGEAPQTDEQDMGMTYAELGMYGRLRKLARCGPVSMLRQLLVLWRGQCVPLLAALAACGHTLCSIYMHRAACMRVHQIPYTYTCPCMHTHAHTTHMCTQQGMKASKFTGAFALGEKTCTSSSFDSLA